MTTAVLVRRGFLVRAAALGCAALLMWIGGIEAQEPVYSEAEVKGAFLYHFGSYVQWPAPEAPNAPITIAVLGSGAVATELERFLGPGRRIQDRPVNARRIESVESIGDADVLYVGVEHSERLEEIVAGLEDSSVLIVTDVAGGLERGAMVNFQVVDQRVRFEISLGNAERAGLMLSSRLLAAALRVETSHSGPDLRFVRRFMLAASPAVRATRA